MKQNGNSITKSVGDAGAGKALAGKTGGSGYVMVFLAGSMWGTIGLFANFLSAMGMDSTSTAFYRLLFGTVLLVPMLLLAGRGPKLFRVSRRGLISCALVGFLSQGLYNLCYMYAIEKASMSTAAVLLYTSPVFVAIMSRLFFREHLTSAKILAILINIAGCILTVTGGNFTTLKISVFGLLMGLGAGFTYALMPVLSRIGADRENPLTSAFYGLGFGALGLLFIARPWHDAAFTWSGPMFLVLLGYGLIPTALGYIVYFGGLAKVRETSIVPVLASVETVVAALIGFLMFHDAFSIPKVLGIALVFCSIIVMNRRAPARS